MNAATLLQVLENGMTSAVTSKGGTLDVASDPDHVVEILSGSDPSGWRLVLGYAGESAVDPDDAPGIRDIEITFTVQAARGLKVKGGGEVHRPTGAGRLALLQLSDQVDRWVRGFQGTTYGDVSDSFKFVNRAWLAIEGKPNRQVIATYRLRIGNDPVQEEDKITLTFPDPNA